MFLETFEKELRLNDYNFTYAFEEIKGDVEKAISESHVIDSSSNAGKSHASIVLNLIEKDAGGNLYLENCMFIVACLA